MGTHPDLEQEQAYIDHAYACLEATRANATRMTSMVEVGRGGTEQARVERDIIWDTLVHRLAELDLGNRALCFGRIDCSLAAVTAPAGGEHGAGDPAGGDGGRNGDGGPRAAAHRGNGDGHAHHAGSTDGPAGRPAPDVGDPVDGTFYIGRVAVSDEHQEPVVVDWRAPVAEAFYRATGAEPMGLVRRRHFASRGRTLLGIEDELFGEAAAALDEAGPGAVQGYGALISALETARTGRLGDIVATIQGEQDEIIRAPMPGVLVCQGGPGTGKTVVALHRAAYLLYTNRFPLERQGVLVVGPNRLFLGYIEQVLPALGEAGVELAVLADLLPGDLRVAGRDTGRAARVKGDRRMSQVLARAVRHRELALREPLRVGHGVQTLSVSVEESRRIVKGARRRHRKHNAGRRHVEAELFAALAGSGRGDLDPDEVRERLRGTPEVRAALEWMWPVLTPAELLNDLFGSPGLLRQASRGTLDDEEWAALQRERSREVREVVWTHDDVPLLDEARALLGPVPRRRRDGERADDGVRTYGHIVVDEAQDLSPMQLQMLNRRSLGGSMTVVGDIAQATGEWAHGTWEEILELLPDRRPPRRVELTTGYRLPAPITALAARVLREAAPELQPPRSIREDGDPPRVVATGPGRLVDGVVDEVRHELAAVGVGNVAVICPQTLADPLAAALARAGIEHGRATRSGLESQVTVVPVGLVKGLELDASVVVEPARLVEEEAQGMRALYVALTRATRRLSVVHEAPLPVAMADPPAG